jgi:hypothetical protein
MRNGSYEDRSWYIEECDKEPWKGSRVERMADISFSMKRFIRYE